ncbi:MAG: hypothetical protein QF689_18150 [Candidatus Latescibacteria bacterium]|nr:hypothetical protein [Candidatus Latescibacterota bacterium]HJN28662.1 hypothetical protein [Candidatus Latescibacterota bacterium]|tara:strand:+ start:143 stop:1114 length:972 start_codon:yes stop_codon:yes gene_type:complete
MSQVTSTGPAWLTAAGAGARWLVGIIFVVAGLAKAYEPVLFYWEAISYVELLNIERESWPQLGALAVFVLPVLETGVGVALIANWHRRWTLSLAIAMIGLFIALTGHAWQQGAEINCGCFGTLAERTPGEALVEDLFMMGALLVAWRWGTERWVPSLALRRVILGVAALSLVLVLVGYLPESDRIASSDLKPGVSLKGLDLAGADVDLSEGTYLVELFSPRCGRCAAAVPKLNYWAETPGVPPIVALHTFPPESKYITDFVRQLEPKYVIASISSSDWKRLTWRHGWPRLALVEDGEIQRVWEHTGMPSARYLVELAANSESD